MKNTHDIHQLIQFAMLQDDVDGIKFACYSTQQAKRYYRNYIRLAAKGRPDVYCDICAENPELVNHDRS